MFGMIIGGIMVAAGVFLTLVPPFFIGPILFVAGLIIGFRGMTKTAVTGVKLAASATSAIAARDQSSTNQYLACGAAPSRDQVKWATLLEIDPDLKSAAETVGAFGPEYVDQLATKYLAVESKSYLPAIVDSVVAHAKHLAAEQALIREEDERNRIAHQENVREQQFLAAERQKRRRASLLKWGPIVAGIIAVTLGGFFVYDRLTREHFDPSDLSGPKTWDSEEAAVLFMMEQAEAGVTDIDSQLRWQKEGEKLTLHGRHVRGGKQFSRSVSAKKPGACKYELTNQYDGGKPYTETIDVSKTISAEQLGKGSLTRVALKGSVDEFYCTRSFEGFARCGGNPADRESACSKTYPECPKNINPRTVLQWFPEDYAARVISAYQFLRSKCSTF